MNKIIGLIWIAFTALAYGMVSVGMTALTVDRNTQSREAYAKQYGVAATTQIYKGSLVCLSATGYLVPAADTAGLSAVVGVADENVLGTTDGVKVCRVVSGRAFRFGATSITVAMHGTTMFVVDDQIMDDAVGSANGIVVGTLLERISATEGWVFIPHGGSAPAVEGGGGLGALQYRDIQFTAAQLIDMKDTNIEVIPAPGAGLAVIPIGIHMFLDHGGTDFVQAAATDQFALLYNGGSEIVEIGLAATFEAFIEASVDAAMSVWWGEATGVGGETPVANTAIDMDNNGATDLTTGDGTMSCRVWFVTVPMAAFA